MRPTFPQCVGTFPVELAAILSTSSSLKNSPHASLVMYYSRLVVVVGNAANGGPTLWDERAAGGVEI